MRIAIGFYVDSKHKWSGSSKELAIKRNVVSGKQNFRLSPGQISKTKKIWCGCVFYTVLTQFDRTVSLTATYVDTSFSVCVTGFRGLERTSLSICLCK